jgi:electron transfer flavoprotein alpha subunit
MQPIGLLIEFKDGRVKKANFGMATAARGENRHLIALVVDASAGEAKASLEAYGVARIINISAGKRGWDPSIQAAAVVAAVEQFDITNVIGLTSPAGRELLPRIAARLDAPLVMDCTEIDLSGHRVKTSQYSGKTIATIALTGRHFIYGIRPNVVAPQEAPTEAEVVDFAFEENRSTRYQVIETRTALRLRQKNECLRGRLTGGRGQRLGALCHAGWSDRREGKPQGLHRRRHLRLRPAFCRDENRQNDHCHQLRCQRRHHGQLRLLCRGRSF